MMIQGSFPGLLRAACALIVLISGSDAWAKAYRGAEYRTVQQFTYGRFEVRMKSAAVSGMLSSFFTYHEISSNAEWNEIDIEIMGRYNNEVQFNVITPNVVNHVQRQNLKFNPHAAFHIYAIEWTPDYVAWSVDGTEVYRQTESHIATVNRPQKLMMNIWQPSAVDWAGGFNAAQLPTYAYYDWIRYSAYTPGVGDNFTLQWTDNFNAFDAFRWQKATHTWDGNNSVFVQENVVFKDGYMILCLTDSAHSGYNNSPVPDNDVDPPSLVAARAYDNTVLVTFSEPLDRTSAEDVTNYAAGVAIRNAALQPDTRTVRLTVEGMDLSSPFILFVSNVKDLAVPPHSMPPVQTIRVIMPLAFPLKINVGGGAVAGYIADSIWAWAKEYGGTGGVPVQVPPSTVIAGTSDPDIYRSALEGIGFYRIRVPNGTYHVTLLLAETKFTSPGQRVFSVKVKGQTVLSNVDIVQQGGVNSAVEKTISNMTVSDGLLELYFLPVTDKPLLSGIRVERVVSGIQKGDREPFRFGLDVYPNPFNGEAQLQYSLPGTAFVNLSIYDLCGRLITTIPVGTRQGGEHRLTWAGSGLPSGVYFCRLSADDHSLIRKVVILR